MISSADEQGDMLLTSPKMVSTVHFAALSHLREQRTFGATWAVR